MYLKENAIRNTTILSAPPTGTTSLLADTTSGLEPVFALAYKRKDRVSERVYVHPKMKEWLETNKKKKPDWLVDTSDLTPEDHLDVQVSVQRYLDSAASKTINCPENTSVEDLSALLLEYVRDTKGMTVYVEGSKEGAPLNRLDTSKAREYLKEAETSSDCTLHSCRGGVCDV
jgi:ribonucleoside-diphosphate reductase alpha chain